MHSPETLTQKWLRKNVQSYLHSERVYTDVDAVLLRSSTLRPKADVYTYDDGRTQLLLCLHGLLPISFRSVSYNIPVAIWITRDYPRQPPIVYVVPTNDMLVKASKHVDVSGKCDLELLQHWARKGEGHNLVTLLEAMQEQFSREPPVYAKPRENNTSIQQQQLPHAYQSKPPPPLPPTHISPPITSPPPSFDPPPVPPRPAPSAIVKDFPSGASSTPQLVHNVVSTTVESDPPLPPRPPSGAILPRYSNSFAEPHIPPTGMGHASTLHSSYQHIQAPAIDSRISSPPNPLVTPPRPLQAPSPNFIVPPVSYAQHPPFQQPPLEISSHQPARPPTIDLLGEDSSEPPTSYVSSTTAPPPPRPPNPELLHLQNQVYQKLTSELNSLSQALALDADRLRAHQADLLAGEPAIRDEMGRLEAVRDVCHNVANRMKNCVQQAEINVADLRRKGDPEVDELVCSTTIVHNQLISLVAEDHAIEDTIYHLHRALNAGRIDLERFLRSVRLLAEEQFMKRALIEKIQAGIPLGMSANIDWT